MPVEDDCVYFYSSAKNKEPDSYMYSQFHKAPLNCDQNNRTYNCNEQFYQSEKVKLALRHGCVKVGKPNYGNVAADRTFEAILRAAGGQQQSDLGRDIEMNEAAQKEWKGGEQDDVLYRANKLKFTQNQDERAWLLSTGNREMVECSERDDVCGVGFNIPNAKSNRQRWGQNKLGRALERVRGEIRTELALNPNAYDKYDKARNAHRINEKYRYTPGQYPEYPTGTLGGQNSSLITTPSSFRPPARRKSGDRPAPPSRYQLPSTGREEAWSARPTASQAEISPFFRSSSSSAAVPAPLVCDRGAMLARAKALDRSLVTRVQKTLERDGLVAKLGVLEGI